jgi:hypothetical protein
VMKLGEIERAISEVDGWRETYSRLEEAENAMAAQLRGRGASWEAIGWLFGVSGSAVRQRFGPKLEGLDPLRDGGIVVADPDV